MRKKIKDIKVAIISCLGVLIVGLIGIFAFYKSSDVIDKKSCKNDNYSFKYDTTWKVKNKKKDSVKLVRDKDSKINIQIVNLEEEYKYSTSEEIIEEVLYTIQKQNKKYKLITKQKDDITKQKYDGYKMLYENGKNQVMVAMGKVSDKMLLVTYEASNSYFDILLDSVQNIIYDFEVLDQNYKLSSKIQVDENKIKWSKNSKVKKVSKVEEYEVANNNYLVKYSIPKEFKVDWYDSRGHYHKYEGLDKGSIELNIDIMNTNLYEYMDKDKTYGTVYSPYKLAREGKKGYADFKECLEKIEDKKEVKYIYKTNFTQDIDIDIIKYEEVRIIQEINKSHIVVFSIDASDMTIPKDLVDNITIKFIKNYADYIKRDIIDDKLIGELKEYADDDKKKIRDFTLKIPTKYEEIDYEQNIYERRDYGLEYNEETKKYKYNVVYELSSAPKIDVDSIISANEDTYKKKGDFTKLTYTGDKEINGKKFSVYKGSYTDTYGALSGKYTNTSYKVDYMVLVHNYTEKNALIIQIKASDVKISSDDLMELTDFDIKEK